MTFLFLFFNLLIEGEKLELYKMIFPLSLPHDSLAVVGCLRTNGPIPPVLEIQARLAARVLAGRHRLPERSTMQQDVDQMTKQQLQTYGHVRYAVGVLVAAFTAAIHMHTREQISIHLCMHVHPHTRYILQVMKESWVFYTNNCPEAKKTTTQHLLDLNCLHALALPPPTPTHPR